MKPEKIYLISPREPSGATWLINCLLELGVKVYRETLGEMWEAQRHGEYRLNPFEEHLKKWLPILSKKEGFTFRSDVQVEWAHHWPAKWHRSHRIIYFVRDPRDALLSRYRREAPEMAFGDFLDFPDPYTLLDKIDTWNLFNEIWLQQPELKFFRFEDYKRDAGHTLRSILLHAGISAGEQEILAALENSTFDKAAEAERLYRERHPDDGEMINRAGQVGAWQTSDHTGEITRISERSRRLLAQFEYASPSHATRSSYMPHAKILGFYRKLPVRPGFWQSVAGRQDAATSLKHTMQFALTVDEKTLRRSGLSAYEAHVLLEGVLQLAKDSDSQAIPRIKTLAKCFPVKPWWIIARFMERHNIRMPDIARTWQGKIYRLFRNIPTGN